MPIHGGQRRKFQLVKKTRNLSNNSRGAKNASEHNILRSKLYINELFDDKYDHHWNFCPELHIYQ